MRFVLALCVVLSSFSVWADVSNSAELGPLPHLPDAQVVSYQQREALDRVYPQGSIRRISGKLRFDREVSASGQQTRVTYELPRTETANQAFDSAREALMEQGAHLLYWCVGRECGASSLWANAVFDNPTLYGSDDQQRYALLRLAAPEQDTFVTLYSITRGNRRAYLHAEMLRADTPQSSVLPTPATLQRLLKSAGKLRLPASVEPTPEWVELLARSLNLDSTLRVILAGDHAPVWREALVAKQVRASRLEVDPASGDGLLIKVLP